MDEVIRDAMERVSAARMAMSLIRKKKDLSVAQQGKRTALILSGGGARGAYQVGVLKAISEILPRDVHNPFGIICGTSAGALSASALATHAGRFRAGVLGLEAVWGNLTSDQIYQTDLRTLSRRALQWGGALFAGGPRGGPPTSLLDNAPLRELLTRIVHFDRIQHAIETGDLHALSITASSYDTGHSVSFFQGASTLNGWRRARRIGKPTRITTDHLMASSAIPVVFPAIRIGNEYYGDGSVRQLAPISPALHLGADRVLVIGVSASNEPLSPAAAGNADPGYPSVAQILGHVLNSAFVDSLEGDVERLERVNRTLALIPPEQRQGDSRLRTIEALTISPSVTLEALAADFAHELPKTVRMFLRGSGATARTGSTLMSYLLFEAGFCRELIRLGYHDAMRLEHQILGFLGHDPRQVLGTAAVPQHDVC